MGISIASDTRIDDLIGRWLVNYIREHAQGITLGTWGVQESQVLILGPVGYGPTMWVKSRKGGDVLHNHVSKACQRVTCRLCRQQCRYQGRGTKRTIFLLVEARRTNRQSSRPSVVTGITSTIVTWSNWHGCSPRFYISRRIILLGSHRSQGRLNQTMERKIWLSDQTEQWKGQCV